MKIATNITRSNVGGITVSNINFLNSIHDTGKGVVAFELVSARCLKGATAFSHFSSEWFEHNIINIFDKPIFRVIEKVKNIKELELEYRPIIDLIKKNLKESGANVAFLNGTYYIPWLISIAASELKIPIVLRYAGVYSREMDKFDIAPATKKMFLEIEGSFQKTASYFIFPSTLCREEVKKQLLDDKQKEKMLKRSFVIPNPVNIPKGIKLAPNRERKIAAIGRWDPIKNFSAFFAIHKILLKEKWPHQAKFVTVGGKIPSLPKTIDRLKSVPHGKIYEFYASQGLIISPSTFETFGNVPMEAICLGVPVLINKNMGCADVLKRVGLSEMVMSFDDLRAVAQRAKILCGSKIPEVKIKAIRKILNPENINKRIMSVLRRAVKNKK